MYPVYLTHGKTSLSTEKRQTCTKARISKPHENHGWSQGIKTTTHNWSQATCRVIRMLPRSSRVPANEIARLMKHGRRFVGHGMTLHYRDRRREIVDQRSRFAFIVSTKVDKRATVRNRVRRLLSESVRLHTQELPFALDGVIIAGKQLVARSFEEIEMDIKHVFSSLR